MDHRITTPHPETLRRAFIAFVLTVGAIALLRAREFGPRRMGHVAQQLAQDFTKRFTLDDARAIVADFEDAPAALGALIEELVYIACKYREGASQAQFNISIVGNAEDFADETGSIFGQQVVDDIETVKGSIGRLLEKLPRWAQRLIEALMEALKLTRGG